MVKVGLELFPTWVVGAPCPVLVDLGDGKLIDGNRAVNTGTRVAVLTVINNSDHWISSSSALTQRQVPPKLVPASYRTVLKPCLRSS